MAELERANQSLHAAFPQNDLKKPDFDGHRLEHLKMRQAEEVMQGYKIEASKKVVGWIVIFMLGLVASGAVSMVKDLASK